MTPTVRSLTIDKQKYYFRVITDGYDDNTLSDNQLQVFDMYFNSFKYYWDVLK